MFVHEGIHEDASPKNRGAIANIGFIVGARCVAVIDTGGTFAVGQALRAAIRQATSLPVCYVINTHAHPDHVFGNAAFMLDNPIFVGHARLRMAMSARAANYLNALHRDLGPPATGSEIVLPGKLIKDSETLDLGGRKIRLQAWPAAHTDSDMTVYDENTRTLWLGDLLFIDRVPVVDGSLTGWLAALRQLHTMDTARVIPGHGDVDARWPQSMAAQQRYLTTLLTETRQAIKNGRTIRQAADTVGLSERGRWLLFDRYHRRNVTSAFAELEWEE